MLKEKTHSKTIENFETVTIYKNKVSELEKTNHNLKNANNAANQKISKLKAEIAQLKKQNGQK